LIDSTLEWLFSTRLIRLRISGLQFQDWRAYFFAIFGNPRAVTLHSAVFLGVFKVFVSSLKGDEKR
jgi:hypothetical protein